MVPIGLGLNKIIFLFSIGVSYLFILNTFRDKRRSSVNRQYHHAIDEARGGLQYSEQMRARSSNVYTNARLCRAIFSN